MRDALGKESHFLSVGEQRRELADERIIFVFSVYPEVLQPQSEGYVLSGGLGSLPHHSLDGNLLKLFSFSNRVIELLCIGFGLGSSV